MMTLMQNYTISETIISTYSGIQWYYMYALPLIL